MPIILGLAFTDVEFVNWNYSSYRVIGLNQYSTLQQYNATQYYAILYHKRMISRTTSVFCSTIIVNSYHSSSLSGHQDDYHERGSEFGTDPHWSFF